jgi:hypothetical protein
MHLRTAYDIFNLYGAASAVWRLLTVNKNTAFSANKNTALNHL